MSAERGPVAHKSLFQALLSQLHPGRSAIHCNAYLCIQREHYAEWSAAMRASKPSQGA